MGELKINELRQYAHHTLNENFDILIFHDRVLEAGPIPLDILEHHIKRWVASQEPSQKLKKRHATEIKTATQKKTSARSFSRPEYLTALARCEVAKVMASQREAGDSIKRCGRGPNAKADTSSQQGLQANLGTFSCLIA